MQWIIMIVDIAINFPCAYNRLQENARIKLIIIIR